MSEEWKWVENTDVCMENSFGSIRSTYTEMEFILRLTKNKYGVYTNGSFEVYDTQSAGDEYYGEGGLWFRDNILVDYDGVYALMPQIVRKLKELGLGTGEEE
tara:strand:+ start:1630 stop:1935 length:306 start_codon:yes stop_codon:yes gene_type:complete